MYLNKLESNEKLAFLELAHHMARSDVFFSDKEKDVIEAYCVEIGIEDIEYEDNDLDLDLDLDLDKKLSYFRNQNSHNIVLMGVL